MWKAAIWTGRMCPWTIMETKATIVSASNKARKRAREKLFQYPCLSVT